VPGADGLMTPTEGRPTIIFGIAVIAILAGIAARAANRVPGNRVEMTSLPERPRAGLERLFDAEMAYRPGMEEVGTPEDREGVLLGSGDGVVRGKRIHGRIRWSFYSADCLYPAIRAGAQVPADLHICRVNPRGVIETDDGAQIWFDAKGFGLRGYDPVEPGRYILTLSLRFSTGDRRYTWLNSVLGLWEGRFNERTASASYTAYLSAR
jgi:hypothetical protein